MNKEYIKAMEYFKTLHLETLKKIKDSFELCSDGSTSCLGYRNLCSLIDNIEYLDDHEKDWRR